MYFLCALPSYLTYQSHYEMTDKFMIRSKNYQIKVSPPEKKARKADSNMMDWYYDNGEYGDDGV